MAKTYHGMGPVYLLLYGPVGSIYMVVGSITGFLWSLASDIFGVLFRGENWSEYGIANLSKKNKTKTWIIYFRMREKFEDTKVVTGTDCICQSRPLRPPWEKNRKWISFEPPLCCLFDLRNNVNLFDHFACQICFSDCMERCFEMPNFWLLTWNATSICLGF